MSPIITVSILKNTTYCQNLTIVYIAVGDACAGVAGMYDSAVACINSNVSAIADDITGLHVAGADSIADTTVCR